MQHSLNRSQDEMEALAESITDSLSHPRLRRRYHQKMNQRDRDRDEKPQRHDN